MFFNILATFAEFEVDLLRMRTRAGMAVAKAKGKLRGKQPERSPKPQTEWRRMHGTGEYSSNDLAELFSIGRATVYRTLPRNGGRCHVPYRLPMTRRSWSYSACCGSPSAWTAPSGWATRKCGARPLQGLKRARDAGGPSRNARVSEIFV